MPTGGSLMEAAGEILSDLVALRRSIHAEPELGLFTPRTTGKVKDALRGLPLEITEGASTSGFMARLRGGRAAAGARRTVLLRGDMDALPLEEDTGLAFSSTIPGAMHACGHDAHAAMLVGAARLLSARADRLAGDVLFMFQPGEEGHHGARFMIEDRLLEPRPDAAFALHVMPNAPFGVVSSRAGSLLASADQVRIVVTGRGGHGSTPHEAIDPIPIVCEIVLALQVHVARRAPVSDPAVLTVGKIAAGTTDNVIPEQAELLATVRTLSPERRAATLEAIRRIASSLAEAHGGKADVDVVGGFPPTICAPEAVMLGRQCVSELWGPQAWESLPQPYMNSEDFSYVLQQIPGAMFMLGASAEGSDWRSCCALHSNRMVFDDSVMAKGAALHVAIAERYLSQGFPSPADPP